MAELAMDSLLAQLAQSVSGAEDLETLTRPMLDLLQTMTGLDSTYLTTVDEAKGIQRILYSRNVRQMQMPEGLEVPWGDTLCKRALEEGRAYTNEVADCWGDSDAAKDLGINTYMSQPVRTLDGGLYGTLCAASSSKVAIPVATLNVFKMFAGMIAQQVDRERLMHDLRKDNARLALNSLTDPLTGIANRRAMEQELTRMLARAARDGSTVDVAFIDLDGFKGINDKFGHDVGDRFLIHVAGKLLDVTRPGDLLARCGGDEFVVLAPSGGGAAMRERLAAATIGPFDYGAGTIDYRGASVGLAQSEPGETTTPPVLARADAAMYEVKKARKAQR